MKKQRSDEAEIEVVHENGDRTPAIRRTEITYSAPIPPASEFAKYEEALPGSADRILRMAEKQGAHRKFIEKFVVIVDSIKSLLGVISALVIAIGGIAAGVYLILNDKPAGGFAAILGPLGILAAAFIFKTRKEEGDE